MDVDDLFIARAALDGGESGALRVKLLAVLMVTSCSSALPKHQACRAGEEADVLHRGDLLTESSDPRPADITYSLIWSALGNEANTMTMCSGIP